eukprot:CAMPEP_0184330646 /NCGR_PEP_ID=MMETSP1049-20130417/144790_1 /TAXON_ID=77928 /ORGANISM="Proteomonas sulcata, Strain CCMP704" /LENGTH=88 /DNA_ID=CAMNT_0026653095 /DNA_START=1180 /DNA_END=1446 /DNA_ORIENTATION=-
MTWLIPPGASFGMVDGTERISPKPSWWYFLLVLGSTSDMDLKASSSDLGGASILLRGGAGAAKSATYSWCCPTINPISTAGYSGPRMP